MGIWTKLSAAAHKLMPWRAPSLEDHDKPVSRGLVSTGVPQQSGSMRVEGPDLARLDADLENCASVSRTRRNVDEKRDLTAVDSAMKDPRLDTQATPDGPDAVVAVRSRQGGGRVNL